MEESPRSRFGPLSFLFGFGFGIFAGVALALSAIALVRESSKPATAVVVEESPTVPSLIATPTPDLRPRTRAAMDVRLGPGNGFAIIGVLARNEVVEIEGRDASAQWLAIRYPPGSTARGWIRADSVEGFSGVDALAVVLPTPIPRAVSTPTLFSPGTRPPTDRATPETEEPVATPTPGLPDLVISRMDVLPDLRVSITVANRGLGDVSGYPIFVQVRDLGTKSEMISTPLVTLRVGQTMTLQTQTFRVEGEQEVIADVDPFETIPEINERNNTLQATLAPPITPTATPTFPGLPID
jgi:hypothetical protein